MVIYSIGFTKKSAETFFERLRQAGIRRLVDIRLNPGGQLSGFAKQDDLPYFLDRLSDGCQYVHLPILAPTKDMLADYRNDGDWERYATRFEQLLDERSVPQVLDRSEFNNSPSCLLCSEPTAEHCHRRLVAERLSANWPDVQVVHL